MFALLTTATALTAPVQPDALVAWLADPEYVTREHAESRLGRMYPAAEPAVALGLRSHIPETSLRCRRIWVRWRPERLKVAEAIVDREFRSGVLPYLDSAWWQPETQTYWPTTDAQHELKARLQSILTYPSQPSPDDPFPQYRRATKIILSELVADGTPLPEIRTFLADVWERERDCGLHHKWAYKGPECWAW